MLETQWRSKILEHNTFWKILLEEANTEVYYSALEEVKRSISFKEI